MDKLLEMLRKFNVKTASMSDDGLLVAVEFFPLEPDPADDAAAVQPFITEDAVSADDLRFGSS